MLYANNGKLLHYVDLSVREILLDEASSGGGDPRKDNTIARERASIQREHFSIFIHLPKTEVISCSVARETGKFFLFFLSLRTRKMLNLNSRVEILPCGSSQRVHLKRPRIFAFSPWLYGTHHLNLFPLRLTYEYKQIVQ